MLYREIIAVCSQTHTKHINTLCGQNVELVNVKPGCTYSEWPLGHTHLMHSVQNKDERCTNFFICIVFLVVMSSVAVLYWRRRNLANKIGVGGRGGQTDHGYWDQIWEGRYVWPIPWRACIPFHHCHCSPFYLPLLISIAPQKYSYLEK